ncbi:MAG: hypothetical protein ACI97P_000766 [Arcticibacterium sp.]|jgi:hypothetical protein
MNKVFTLLALLGSFMGNAQGYFPLAQETFGKNRIQLKKLDWKTINSNNFEFNYYRGGQEIAQKAAKTAEGGYRKITEILGYTPFTTMKIFLYNTPRQLEQSNIGLTTPIEYDGGVLNLSRSRIEIPYSGNDSIFQSELIREISRLFVYDMLFGGSLKEVLQSSLLLTVPEWYMAGISEYIASDGMNSEDFASAREAIQRNGNRKLNNLSSKDAKIIGKSIWHYIAERYGPDNISNILNLTRIIRTEQSSITSTLGVSFNRFQNEWRAYYLNGSSPEEAAIKAPESTKVNFGSSSLKIPRLTNLKDKEIDTEYYEFEEINVLKAADFLSKIEPEHSSTFNRKRLKRGLEEFKLSPPKSYQNLLVTQDLNTTLLNDPVRRIGVQGSLVINDLLENHIFNFELFITPIVKNHDLKASYNNYEKRTDWGVEFSRKSIFLERRNDRNNEILNYLLSPLGFNAIPDRLSRRVYLHTINGHISYPLSQNLKVNFRPSLFFNNDINYADVSIDTESTSYAGLNAEIIYDDTERILGSAFLSGTRAKISYRKNLGLSDATQNFNGLFIDARHYQNITSGLQIAGRLSYGSSTGPSPKYTFLGGTENTLNRTIYENPNQGLQTESGNLRDLVFYNYGGDLRGFDFARLHGTKHLLFNLELRLSLGGYFSKNTVTSSVIRNLQLVAFADVGTAWEGENGPWSRQNSLNTQSIGGATALGGNPFSAVVTNFKNPFLTGLGGGIRTTVLGFFIKGDYGFGLENKEFSEGKFYLSLGHGF